MRPGGSHCIPEILGEDLLDDAAVDVGQAVVAAAVAVGQLLMSRPNRCSSVACRSWCGPCSRPQWRRSHRWRRRAGRLHAAARHPHAEAGGIVVAAVSALALRVRPNSPPHITIVSLSRPRSFRSVSSAPIGWSIWPQSEVSRLFRRRACPNRRGPARRTVRPTRPGDAPSGTAGRSCRYRRHRPGCPCCRRRCRPCRCHTSPASSAILREVEHRGQSGLHAEAQLERVDHALDGRINLVASDQVLVHLVEQVELAALGRRRQVRPDVADAGGGK